MSYAHINTDERKKLSFLSWLGCSVRTIAKELNRSPSTISRELRRNALENGEYRSDIANEKYQARRTNSRPDGKLNDDYIIEYINENLANGWSPEQISGRLALEQENIAEEEQKSVSTSTIYRWLNNRLFPNAEILEKNLRQHGKKRGKKSRKFKDGRRIDERPEVVDNRERRGDWEVDTIVSAKGGQACILSVCDRKSRYCGLIHLPRKGAMEVTRGFRELFGSCQLPLETATGDRGSEFAWYEAFEENWGVPFYFANPGSPWQKPTVENLNGLVRQYFPKGTNFDKVTPEQVNNAMETLNNRPRKCLDYRTPAEVLKGQHC